MRPGLTSASLLAIIGSHIMIDMQPNLKSTLETLFDWVLGYTSTLPAYPCEMQPILTLVLEIIEPYVDNAFGVSSNESLRIAHLLNT